MKKFTLTQVLPWFYFSLFIAVVLMLNHCYSFCSDDCMYGLNIANTTAEITPRFKTIGEVAYTNFIIDGYRPIVHFFVRLFSGLLGHFWWVIANSAVMVLFCLLVNRIASKNWQISLENIVLGLFLILLILCKGESYLWCAGSGNYLWAGTVTLGFWLICEHLETRTLHKWEIPLLASFAFIAGWVQEAFSLPICFALGLYYLFNLRKLSVAKIIIFFFYFLGALILTLTSAKRCASIGGFSLLGLIGTQIKILFALKGVWVLAIYFLFKCDKRTFLKLHTRELLVILGSYLMISVVGFNGERSLWAANLFSILILLKEIKLTRGITIAIGTTSIIIWTILITFGIQIKSNFNFFLENYLNSESRITCHERVACGIFARFFHQSIYTWQSTMHGEYFATYHGCKEAPLALSREMYTKLYLKDEFCIPENKLPISGDFYTTPSSNAIVMPISSEQESSPAFQASIAYQHKQGIAAWLKRELAKRKDPPVPDLSKTRLLKTSHGTYLLIGKLPKCDMCITSISLKPLNAQNKKSQGPAYWGIPQE